MAVDTDGDGTNDICGECIQNSDCEDGNFCSADVCNVTTYTCETSPNCVDGDICTDDSCNEEDDVCVNSYDETNAPECVVELCGNGIIDEGESCDFGDLNGTEVNGQTCEPVTCILSNPIESCACNMYEFEDEAGWPSEGIGQQDLAIIS